MFVASDVVPTARFGEQGSTRCTPPSHLPTTRPATRPGPAEQHRRIVGPTRSVSGVSALRASVVFDDSDDDESGGECVCVCVCVCVCNEMYEVRSLTHTHTLQKVSSRV